MVACCRKTESRTLHGGVRGLTIVVENAIFSSGRVGPIGLGIVSTYYAADGGSTQTDGSKTDVAFDFRGRRFESKQFLSVRVEHKTALYFEKNIRC